MRVSENYKEQSFKRSDDCDVCRGTDYASNQVYFVCNPHWKLITAPHVCNRVLTDEDAKVIAELANLDMLELARLPRKQGHKDWCALTCRRGTTCDCDWFEQEARGFGEGPPGHRAVVVPWPPVLG